MVVISGRILRTTRLHHQTNTSKCNWYGSDSTPKIKKKSLLNLFEYFLKF